MGQKRGCLRGCWASCLPRGGAPNPGQNRARRKSRTSVSSSRVPTGDLPELTGIESRWGTGVSAFARIGSFAHASFADEYELTSSAVGTGMSGAVVLARLRQHRSFQCAGGAEQHGTSSEYCASGSEHLVAVKTLRIDGLTPANLERLLVEVDIYMKMDHASIVPLLRVFREVDRILLVMEYCSGGPLSDRLLELKYFSPPEAALAIQQVLDAVNYCHTHTAGRVCHRDLKHSNFVYSSREPGAQLKLVDFGLSRVLSADNPAIRSYAGTLHFMAPEVVRQERYDESCDLWSVGVMTYVLLCGEAPFHERTDKATTIAIVNGRYKMEGGAWPSVPELAKDFVRSLLRVTPQERPTADEALRHPWLAGCKTDPASASATPRNAVAISSDVLEQVRHFANASAVKRSVAAMVIYSEGAPRGEDVGALKAQFRALDTSGDGKISVEEMAEAMHLTLGIGKEEAERIFEQVDLDGDRQIHYSEFLTAAIGMRLLQLDDVTASVFNRFDVDQSGTVSIEELEVALGDKVCGQRTRDIFAELDTNGDMSIDLDEFRSAVGPKRPELQRALPPGDECAAFEPLGPPGCIKDQVCSAMRGRGGSADFSGTLADVSPTRSRAASHHYVLPLFVYGDALYLWPEIISSMRTSSVEHAFQEAASIASCVGFRRDRDSGWTIFALARAGRAVANGFNRIDWYDSRDFVEELALSEERRRASIRRRVRDGLRRAVICINWVARAREKSVRAKQLAIAPPLPRVILRKVAMWLCAATFKRFLGWLLHIRKR